MDLSHVVDGAVVVWVRIAGPASAERLDVAPLDLPPTLNAECFDGVQAPVCVEGESPLPHDVGGFGA
ncbi:hypothetical protein [Myceligenerans salitolerans]|uniref:hypothetical protein n=1 Tax=Myceligenerans salitolerans TaxID=1230528 RepID=UPI001F5EC809|nr:hypothetical protein [Myceligenerans salitolerans]